jgi:uncharacterized protein (UPF0262 family)
MRLQIGNMKDLYRIKKISFRDIDIEAPRSPCEDMRTIIRDLVAGKNYFCPVGDKNGPYDLEMAIVENRLGFHIRNCEGDGLPALYISFSPYRKLIGDYFILCGSYQDARKNAGPSRLEAIDMGRRALHNEGASLLLERLSHRIEMDLPTARNLFTIMCVLHGRHGPI